MKYYRYMSAKEFNLLTAGCKLVHTGKFHARTISNGFCFLGEKTNFSVWDEDGEEINFTYTPEQCLLYLEGIVSDDVLVEFESEMELTKSWGTYADPTCISGYDGTIDPAEYCIKEYDREIMRPVRYCVGDNWYQCN